MTWELKQLNVCTATEICMQEKFNIERFNIPITNSNLIIFIKKKSYLFIIKQRIMCLCNIKICWLLNPAMYDLKLFWLNQT